MPPIRVKCYYWSIIRPDGAELMEWIGADSRRSDGLKRAEAAIFREQANTDGKGTQAMYEAHFGFQRRPFASVPRVDQYFPGAAIEAARQTLVRCIERAEGAGMVVGPSGTGKTLLCQVLAEQFRESFAVAMLNGRLDTRRSLLQAILHQLGQPYRDMDEGELRLALVDYLSATEECPAGMLLLVDEAHTLPLRLLEEIRMIGNLICDGQPRIRTVLAGGPVLEERFASPKLESFSQRLIARCYLEAFNRTETEEYIRAQLSRAGGSAESIFPPDACQAVYQATDGVPRLINQVCDHALLLAYAGGRGQINVLGVEEAWADLQQLPTPWTGDSQEQTENTVIEFGGLDDEPPTEEPAVLPPLLVHPTDEEQIVEPTEQLDRIEETLSGIDEEFKPAGSIGPETELAFDEPHSAAGTLDNPIDEPFEAPAEASNPFDESFEEEETIAIDRHVSADADTRLEQEAVDQIEEVEAPAPAMEVPEPVGSEPVEAAAASPEESAAQQPVGTLDIKPQSREVPGMTDVEPETVPMHGLEVAVLLEPEEDEDADLIVVGDACHHEGARPVRPVSSARRQEYRQLFSKLRRG